MNPRKPTEAEKKELVEFLIRDQDPEAFDLGRVSDEDRDTIKGYVENAAIAVFDDYVTSSPGYAGKVMVVVYDGGTNQTETYSWNTLSGLIERDVEIQQQ